MTANVPDLAAVSDATSRYLQTLDGITDKSLSEPSLLPGWTRAHVVSHLARNALGMHRALNGVLHAEVVPIYDSTEARNADINQSASLSRDELRELSFDACGRLESVLRHVSPDLQDTTIERVPGVPGFTVAQLPVARTCEVEIHHADLGLDFTQRDWPAPFAAYLLEAAAYDRGGDHDLLLRTPDGDVAVGSGDGPVITGSAADLAWWLVGRGVGDGLAGDVPTLGPWQRRTPAK